jgi:hypothetical protein
MAWGKQQTVQRKTNASVGARERYEDALNIAFYVESPLEATTPFEIGYLEWGITYTFFALREPGMNCSAEPQQIALSSDVR